MNKIISVLLAAALLFSMNLCGGFLSANAADTRASNYISYCEVTLSQGKTGEAILNYYVEAVTVSNTKIGISKIEIYTAFGDYVKTINGSTSNGLIVKSAKTHEGNYSITLPTGQIYYAYVTFIVENSTGSETKSISTNTLTLS